MTARKGARQSSSTIHDSKENCNIHTSTRLISMQNPFQKVETVALDIGSRCFESYTSLLRIFPPLPTQHPLSHSQRQREKINKCSCVCNIPNRYKYGKILWKACLQALQINILELTVLQAKQNKTLEDSKINPTSQESWTRIPKSIPTQQSSLSKLCVPFTSSPSWLKALCHHHLPISTQLYAWNQKLKRGTCREHLQEKFHEWSSHMNYGKLVRWRTRLAASICKKASCCWKNVKRKHGKHSEL